MGLVLVLSISIVLVSLLLFKKFPFHPLLMYLIIWGSVTGLWSLDEIWSLFGYYPISADTWAIMLTSHLAFIIGSLAASLFSGAFSQKISDSSPDLTYATLNKKKLLHVADLLFFLSVLGYVSFIREAIKYIDFSSNLSMIFRIWNLQSSGINELNNFGGIWGRLYVLPGLAILYNIYILEEIPTRRTRVLLFTLLEIVFLISPRRVYLIQTLAAALILAFFRYRKHLKRLIKLTAVVTGVLAVFFAYTQMILRKTDSFRGGVKAIYLYITGNIPALEFQMHELASTGGALVFNVFFKMVNSLGLFPFEPDLSIEFAAIPMDYNTVPYFYYSLIDFGMAGSLVFIATIAFVITFFYERYRNAATFPALFFLSYLTVFIIFSFRENVLITYNFWFYTLGSLLIGLWINQGRLLEMKGAEKNNNA